MRNNQELSSHLLRHGLIAMTSLAGLWALPATAQSPKTNICGATPQAPICNIPKCTPDGWKIWPIPTNSSCQISGVQGSCDGGKLGPPGQLEPDEIGHCITTNPAGSLNPQYYVLGVIYAPPGFTGNASQASNVSYGSGNSFSHDTKVTSSFEQGVTVTASVNIPILSDVVPLSASANAGYTTTASTTNGLTVTKSATTTIAYPGEPVDGIDHDQDEIYLWLNPRVSFAQSGNSTLWTLGINPDTPAGKSMDVQVCQGRDAEGHDSDGHGGGQRVGVPQYHQGTIPRAHRHGSICERQHVDRHQPFSAEWAVIPLRKISTVDAVSANRLNRPIVDVLGDDREYRWSVAHRWYRDHLEQADGRRELDLDQFQCNYRYHYYD